MMSATKPKRDRTEIETIEDPRVFSETEDTRKVTKKKSKVITEDAIFELRKWNLRWILTSLKDIVSHSKQEKGGCEYLQGKCRYQLARVLWG